MNHKLLKRALTFLLTLMLIVGMVPTTVFAIDPVENTAPAVENFATADELRANFDMDDSTADKTFKKVYFGKNKTWSIVGVDPAGGGLVLLSQNSTPWSYFSSSTDVKGYDPAWGIAYEDGFVPEKVAPNHYGASDMRAAFQSYTESGNSACFFTDAQLDMIIPTTIYTADVYNTDENGNPRVYHSTELLYPTYSTDYKSASEGRIPFVTVGSNSAENLGTELKVSLKTNVHSSFTRSAWVSEPNNKNYVLTNTGNGVDLRYASDNRYSYVPVFQLDTSNVLFGSIYEGVSAEGEQKDSYNRKTFTLRMDAEKSNVDLGEAHITAPAMEYVTVKDAPEGTFLVAQCGEGAWAKAVSGDMTFSASDLSGGKITSFKNCRVWLEKTDSDAMMTYASYADTVESYSVGITGNAKLVRDENSGAENQVSLDNAPIKDIVYTTVEDYYFPEDYCDTLSNNGITVTRNSDTQITISGTPTSDFYLTLPVPGYRGTKDQWDGVTVASGYESGDGTQDNPYVIANSEQFAYFAQQMQSEDYNGAGEYFVLTADLELTAADWKPVFRFDGSFDGNGHTIVYTQQEGMFTTNDVNQRFYYFGLFGIQRGTVSDLNVSGDILVSVPAGFKIADLNVGGICGYTRGTVSHCSSDVAIRFEESKNLTFYVGGIAGQIDNDAKDPGVVEYCGYSGTIAGNIGSAKAGGIAGLMRGGTIRQCLNKGAIDLTAAWNTFAGGIIGTIYDMNYTKTRVIESCYNWGMVSGGVANSNTANVGGIGGSLEAEKGTGANYYDASTISGCYSIGMLSSSSGHTSPLSPRVGGHVEVSNNYCLEDEDKNTEKVADKAELFERLNAFAPNTWFTDKVTGEVRLLWELYVPVAPEAVFNADSENGGVLSNVVAGMMYSVDGGNTWAEIMDTTAAITGVTVENGIQVYLPGDFHETNDSPVQTIAVTKATAPTTVDAKGCTTTEQNDGLITGVDGTMEYKAENGNGWIAITGDTVIGLTPDNYLIRVKANETVLASDAVRTTVSAHICTAEGKWKYDENNHWKLCACGVKVGEEAHTGGVAACTEQPVCTVCGKKYGDVLGHDFSGDFDEYDTNGHWHICNRTGCMQTDAPVNHSFTNYTYNEDATYFADGTETAYCDAGGCEQTNTRTKSGSMLKDTIVPGGTIKVEENSWKSFINTITFKIFCNDRYDVTITAEDNETGIANVEYLLSDTPISESDIADRTDWQTYNKFSIENEGEYIIYAKITDNAGNTTYISSDGMVVDKTAPGLNGIVNGGTYCGSIEVTVSDDYLGTVTIDNKEVTVTDGKFTVVPADGKQTIIVNDKAANKITYRITVNAGHTFTNYVSDNNATCIQDGTKTSKCKYCNVTDTISDKGTAFGHNWGEPVWNWAEDGKTATVTFTCQNDSQHMETLDCIVTDKVKTPASCTEMGVTTYTAEVDFDSKTYTEEKDITDIPELGHGETELKSAKEATCTDEGYTGDKVCQACGEILEKGKVIPKLAHRYKNDKCTVCGAVDPDYEPTELKKQDQERTASPKTGDNSNIVLWIVLLFISGVGVLSAIVYYKKRKQDQ